MYLVNFFKQNQAILLSLWALIIQGMGNDGGDIPGRKQLVRQKAKVQPASVQSIAMGRARFCNLTNNPLREPLAICRLGNIYNYQQILGALARKELPEKYSYITKLSDVKKIIIERTTTGSVNYIACPITKLEFNGFNKFVAFWSCGHMISRKALKEVKNESQVCVVCQKEYQDKDIIDLNLEGEKLEIMRKILLERKRKRDRANEGEDKEGKDDLKKKVKTDVHINPLDRLSGEFRDVIRSRNNFKNLFKKEEDKDASKNTYLAQPKYLDIK